MIPPMRGVVDSVPTWLLVGLAIDSQPFREGSAQFFEGTR